MKEQSIEDYANECEALHKCSHIMGPLTSSEDHHLLEYAEPFWRKLAMRYREIMKDAAKEANNGYLNATLDSGVITIDSDHFYSCCGYVRDCLDIELKKTKVELEKYMNEMDFQAEVPEERI